MKRSEIEDLKTVACCREHDLICWKAYDYILRLEEENKYLKMDMPEQNIEHFRIIKENRRKIGNLRAENKQLKADVQEANDNAAWWKARYKAVKDAVVDISKE